MLKNDKFKCVPQSEWFGYYLYFVIVHIIVFSENKYNMIFKFFFNETN